MPGEFMTDFRLVGAVLMGLLLAWWTYERALRDDARDPVIRRSTSSQAGSSSILISGFDAVFVVSAGIATLLLAPVGAGPLIDSPQLLLLALGVVAMAHYFVETEEVE